MIVRPDALRLLASRRTNQAVITTMLVAWEWPYFSNNPDLDFAQRSVMGEAPSIGLGVALAQPDRQVWILNGDGSQIMSLGSIPTIANAGAKNVVLFVFQNDSYEVTGGQPIPLAGEVDFATAARGLGFKNSYPFDDISEFEGALTEILSQDGPTFVNLRVVPGETFKVPSINMLDEVTKFSRSLQFRL